MPNMSYCRFQNTLADLQDCCDHMDWIDLDTSKLSDEEKEAAKELINLCKKIAEENYAE